MYRYDHGYHYYYIYISASFWRDHHNRFFLCGLEWPSSLINGNEADFLGFLQKLVPHESLTLPFGQFRFWIRIRGDICTRKTIPRYHRYGESPTLRIGDTGSRRLTVLLSRGVDDSPHHWYPESVTPRITDTESRLLNFLKENSVSMIRRVVDSPHQWYGESPTPCIVESESRRLRISPIRRVDDSAYRWYGKSLFQKKISLASIFSSSNG